MLTPRRVVHIARLIFLIGVVVLAVLVLGPFQGLEERIGLSDKSAHVIAFYLLGVSALAIAPKWRRTDLMLALLGGGVLVEVLQGFTGRSMSLGDLGADALGLAAAAAPGFIEQLRRLARRHPDLSFAEIAARDRRRTRLAEAPAAPYGSSSMSQ